MNPAAIAAALTKVNKAKADNDLVALRIALREAREAGAPPDFVDKALSELDLLEYGPVTNESTPAQDAEALEWKERGNAALKGTDRNKHQTALTCYTSGLNVQGLENPMLMAQLHANRAQVYTLLHQFAEAVDDCRKSLALDPSNTKVCWRAARASSLNELYQQAIDFCDEGLQKDSTNVDLQKLKAQCLEKRDKRQLSRRRVDPDEAMETQDRLNQLREQTISCAQQIQVKETRSRSCTLTLEEITALPEKTHLYASCGQVFLRKPLGTLAEKLRCNVAALEEEVPKLKKSYEELDKRRLGVEKELEEMIRCMKT